MNRQTRYARARKSDGRKLNSPAMRLLRRQLHSGIRTPIGRWCVYDTALDCAAFVVARGLDDFCDEISGSAQQVVSISLSGTSNDHLPLAPHENPQILDGSRFINQPLPFVFHQQSISRKSLCVGRNRCAMPCLQSLTSQSLSFFALPREI
jgi:hypothetical protein